MTSVNWMQMGLSLALLTAAVIDDLRSRKVHNQLLLIFFVLTLGFILIMKGPGALLVSGLSLLTAVVATMPLYFLRAFGGGDVKLLFVLSLLLSWHEVLITLFSSLIWGSLLGLFQVMLKGPGKAFAAQQRQKHLAVAASHIGIALAFGGCIPEMAPAIDHLFGRAAADAKLQTAAGDQVGGAGVFDHVEGIFIPHVDDGSADLDPLRPRADGGEKREG